MLKVAVELAAPSTDDCDTLLDSLVLPTPLARSVAAMVNCVIALGDFG